MAACSMGCGPAPSSAELGALLSSPEAHAAQQDAATAGKSWTTQRSEFWKAEAGSEGAEDRWGASNVERMQKGLAPQLPNSSGGASSVELHHTPVPAREGGRAVVPVTPEEHAAVDAFRRLPGVPEE